MSNISTCSYLAVSSLAYARFRLDLHTFDQSLGPKNICVFVIIIYEYVYYNIQTVYSLIESRSTMYFNHKSTCGVILQLTRQVDNRFVDGRPLCRQGSVVVTFQATIDLGTSAPTAAQLAATDALVVGVLAIVQSTGLAGNTVSSSNFYVVANFSATSTSTATTSTSSMEFLKTRLI